MREEPDIARIASLVGDPARANMLTALMDGGALTASELALEAGVTMPTASSHLAKLVEGGLLTLQRQGRHRYYALSGHHIAAMLETISGVAERVGPRRARPGPRDAAMREARICYDHLAGDRGVALYDSLLSRRILALRADTVDIGPKGQAFFDELGIDLPSLSGQRRPLCRSCLDWSVRRSHLAGALGAAMLDKIMEWKWARRDPQSRAILFSPAGRQNFERLLRE
ncbi:MAG: ArsR/SmtB family transcription factor [Rhizobiaceae bacterium]|jgi:DNA-binding transcriptional ArsR family regulator